MTQMITFDTPPSPCPCSHPYSHQRACGRFRLRRLHRSIATVRGRAWMRLGRTSDAVRWLARAESLRIKSRCAPGSAAEAADMLDPLEPLRDGGGQHSARSQLSSIATLLVDRAIQQISLQARVDGGCLGQLGIESADLDRCIRGRWQQSMADPFLRLTSASFLLLTHSVPVPHPAPLELGLYCSSPLRHPHVIHTSSIRHLHVIRTSR